MAADKHPREICHCIFGEKVGRCACFSNVAINYLDMEAPHNTVSLDVV